MNKTPYFIRNENGTFTFLGYFTNLADAQVAHLGLGDATVVDASFLYRTIDAAKDSLNNMPLPEGCTK